jgi:hypothetical protein
MAKKILQVPVIVGKGSGQFFIEKDIKISPPSPPVYEIKEIKKWIDVYDIKAIPGKVIFNAWLWKDINYKTVEHVHDDSVNGPLFHLTTKIPFGGFVEIKDVEDDDFKDKEKCKDKEKGKEYAELIEAVVEGEIDNLHDKACVCGVTVYEKLLEKTVVRVTFKVVRIEHVAIEEKDGKDKGWKDNKDCCPPHRCY